MGIYIKALLLIILLFAAITFGTQNAESVQLRYYFGLASVPVPLYLVLYVAIIVGMIAGMAIGVSTRSNLKRKAKKLERANASLREELDKIKEVSEEEPTGPEMALAGPEGPQTKVIPATGGEEVENQTSTDDESERQDS